MNTISTFFSLKFLLFLSGAMLLCSSLFFLAHVKRKNIPSFLIGVYLAAVSQIIMIFEVASLFHAVNNRLFFLLANVLLLIIAVSLWLVRGKPALFSVFQDANHRPYFQTPYLLKSLRENGSLAVFGVCLLVIYTYAAYLIIYFPQNVDDILISYLARVGFWLQNGSFEVWKTSVYNLPQVSSPGNAQFLILWTVLFNGADQYAAFTQWSASLVAILAIYGLCRLLKQSKPLAIFIALLFATIPAVTLQLSTAQTDLLASAFFISSVYLLCLGWKDNNTGLLILSALSFAIGVGTKQTVIFALPGLAIILLILFLKFPENKIEKAEVLAGGAFLFTLLLGSYFYIQNFMVFGRPFGPDEVTQTYTGLKEFSPTGQLLMGVKNFVSFVLNSLFSEFFDDKITPILTDVVPQLTSFADYRGSVLPYSVGTVGPMISILSCIGILATLKKQRREKSPISLALLISGIVYLVVIFVIRKYTNAIYRYSILSFALFLPLIGEADFWFRDLDRKTLNKSFIRLISVCSILIMAWIITGDGSKSIYDMIKEPGRTRTMKQMTFVKHEQPLLEPSYTAVDELVPTDASIGLIGTGKYPVSPLFGKNYSRFVNLIVPSDTLSVNAEDYTAIDYLLIDSQLISKGLAVPSGYSAISEEGLLYLYVNENK